jgi:hypothetical protein
MQVAVCRGKASRAIPLLWPNRTRIRLRSSYIRFRAAPTRRARNNRARDMLLRVRGFRVVGNQERIEEQCGPRTMGSSQLQPAPGRTIYFRSQWT